MDEQQKVIVMATMAKNVVCIVSEVSAENVMRHATGASMKDRDQSWHCAMPLCGRWFRSRGNLAMHVTT